MGCEEIQKLSSTDPLAEYRSTTLNRSVNLKDVLGDIQTDYDNFRHGRLPQVVLNTSTLAHRCRRGRPPHHKIASYDSDSIKSALAPFADLSRTSHEVLK